MSTGDRKIIDSFEIVILDREKEFADCLSDMLENKGRRVSLVQSYRDLLEILYLKKAQMIICDLRKDTETENFLQRLKQIDDLPAKIVFTSIFSDAPDWPSLKNLGKNSIILVKPFRIQSLLLFISSPVPAEKLLS